jgi:hypothetical protein
MILLGPPSIYGVCTNVFKRQLCCIQTYSESVSRLVRKLLSLIGIFDISRDDKSESLTVFCTKGSPFLALYKSTLTLTLKAE